MGPASPKSILRKKSSSGDNNNNDNNLNNDSSGQDPYSQRGSVALSSMADYVIVSEQASKMRQICHEGSSTQRKRSVAEGRGGGDESGGDGGGGGGGDEGRGGGDVGDRLTDKRIPKQKPQENLLSDKSIHAMKSKLTTRVTMSSAMLTMTCQDVGDRRVLLIPVSVV